MPEQTDMFPGFETHSIETSLGRIFARSGGKGPPLLLLHGYPQSHVMWHRVSPALANHFTLFLVDLPGYGASDIPPSDPDHRSYTKRAMAQAMIEAMERLGHEQFALAGHDRGGRVGYRLALDHPRRLSKLALLDILPTYDYWNSLNRLSALRIYHWTFLAQPSPVPEDLIRGDPGYFRRIFDAKFDPVAVEHYLHSLEDPRRIHAICEDYRAGAYADFEHDEADLTAGRKIEVPLYVIWGTKGIASSAGTPIEVWKRWATNVTGSAVDAGHFMCEENPHDTSQALLDFLTRAR
ncbi:alpha/beta hydrolase [Bradyrhizobium sp. Ai1a-2]|uniref:alpha/beta fold hydrolase n=1 Tax=Bradyrhizobium sp. Ai1a-2 TaxID=196490 RepID=UPI00040FCCD0|nr:alpha/beta hydrolase [Bradyrhizobium sp. Ai1a-2]